MDTNAPKGSDAKKRTVDQQCTVVRPGLSGIASGWAVEMAAAFLLRSGSLACSYPQQLRGSLMSWNTSALEGTSHVHCPACSPEILRN